MSDELNQYLLQMHQEVRQRAPQPPTAEIPNQMSFIFNNLSFTNLVNHAQFVKDTLSTEEHWQWLSHYLVMKRTPTEPNYHGLYAQFVDLINVNYFTEAVISQTYYFIQELLRSSTMAQSNSDKTCLKNLGKWLGTITLARNKPILTIEIDLKSLLVEAHIKGIEYMRFVLPFVAKVLEPTLQSKIFRPPNPWLISVLSLLLEIRSNPNSELHFKFEVEVLLRNLKIEEKNIPKTESLKSLDVKQKLNEIKHQLSNTLIHSSIPSNTVGPPGSNASVGIAALLMKDDFDFHHFHQHPQHYQNRQLPQSLPPQPMQSSSVISPSQAESFFQQNIFLSAGSNNCIPRFNIIEIKSVFNVHSLLLLIDIKPNIFAMLICPDLRQYVAANILKTIHEVLPGLLERASKIALSTTESLIKKDFCMCTNESLIRSCAHNMIGNLVSGLILIGGREQLFRQMFVNFQQLFAEQLQRRRQFEATNKVSQSSGISSTSNANIMIVTPGNQSMSPVYLDDVCKDAAMLITRDNIDVCVSVMSKLTIHRTMQELERRLVPMYETIRRNIQLSSDHPTYISSVNNERLPEGIRLKKDDLSDSHLANYYQFAKNIAGFSPLPDDVTPDLINFEFVNFVDCLITELVALLAYTQSVISPETEDEKQPTELHKSLLSKINKLHSELVEVRGNHDTHGKFAVNVAQSTSSIIISICYCFMDLYDEEVLFRLSNEYTNRLQDCFFTMFRQFTEINVLGPAWTCKIITKAVADCDQDFRNNLLIIPIFIKFKLLSLSDLDVKLRAEFRNPDSVNQESLLFALNLLRYCLLECGNVHNSNSTSSSNSLSFNLSELQYTIDALQRCAILNPIIDEYVWNVLEVIRVNYDLHNLHDQLRSSTLYRPLLGLPVLYSAVAQVRSDSIRSSINQALFSDLHEKTLKLFEHWVSVQQVIPGVDLSHEDAHHTFANFVTQMNEHGIFKADDCIGGFFRGCVQICITRSYDLFNENDKLTLQLEDKNNKENVNTFASIMSPENGRFHQPTLACRLSSMSAHHEVYEICDAFVKLVVLLIKHSGDSRSFAVKISLLNKVLGLIAGCCLLDSDIRGNSFYPLPYQRMFMSLFRELSNAQFLNESTHYLFTQSIMSAYFLLNPLVCPSFTFVWIELVGHGPFIGKVLQSTGQIKNTQCWTMYASLLSALLRFINPFIIKTAAGEHSDWIPFTFKCILRIFLTLLHDFPEFLVEYAYELIEYIPVCCIQLRNIIFSAFSRQMKLPDPMNQVLKVDLLAEINITPPMYYNYQYRIQPIQFKNSLDNYLNTRSPSTFLSALRSNITHSCGYNMKIINALVLYIGVRAIDRMIRLGHHISADSVADSAHMDVFDSLLSDLDWEGRYLFLNAVVNYIRFPNCHTHFFSCTILHLFKTADSLQAKEQIVRVLTERLIVNRPYPWGLLVTFVELVRNKSYRLMECPFVYKVPEIQRLFESASRSSPLANRAPRGNTN